MPGESGRIEFLPDMKNRAISAGTQTPDIANIHGFDRKACMDLDLLLILVTSKQPVMVAQVANDHNRYVTQFSLFHPNRSST
jgi:hypothetical protein